jgi:hypothetical protein
MKVQPERMRPVTEVPSEEVSWTEFHYSRLADKPARDAIRRAIADAKGSPVWLVNRDGKRTGAIVAAEDAAFLREIRQSLHEAGTGQTVDLGNFAKDAEGG